MFKPLVVSLFVVASVSQAHEVSHKNEYVLTDLASVKAVGAQQIMSSDMNSNLAVAQLTPAQLKQLSILGHSQGKCAGFEVLTEDEAQNAHQVLNNLIQVNQKNFYASSMTAANEIVYTDAYKKIADTTSPSNLTQTVKWLSSYKDRYNKAKDPNVHVRDFVTKLNNMLKDAPWSYKVETVDHKSTRQKSIKLTITGSTRPHEVVVLGGHLDSINMGESLLPIAIAFLKAPGADDNASGSSNLLETVRVLKQVSKFDRTVEVYWYAGEESGLLGSAEIAKTAKGQNKNIIGVLQLDMTLYPGDGAQVIGLITDYTHPWLRKILTEVNNTYVKARFVNSQCGYACSDHASWTRQGFPAVTPFEATMDSMNKWIHTNFDVIDSKSNFQHSDTFTKLAVLYTLHLANSTLKAP